ncbi:MAG: PhzA/PhzB family protein [Bifidobacteriaceae bacterium]|nr:PhzA/PhzB family protein [Bifidobacteriaceae bacterium]
MSIETSRPACETPGADATRARGASDDATRAANYATVDMFLHSGHGDALLRRHELFTEDAVSGLWTSDTGSPAYAQGRDSIAAYDVWSSEHFPDWEWSGIRIWHTDDPNWLWAEADGHGTLALPGHDPVHYENHFIYSFEMRNGLIAREREFMNPIVEMKALGLPTPTIDLGDFPQA